MANSRHHALQQSGAGGTSNQQRPAIRRNLFPSNLSRRPIYTNAPSASSANMSHHSHHSHHHSVASGSRVNDFVERDDNGNAKVDFVPLVPMPLDEEKERAADEKRLIAMHKRCIARRLREQHEHGRTGRNGRSVWELTGLDPATAATYRDSLPGDDADDDIDDDDEEEEEVATPEMDKRMRDALQSYMNRAVTTLDDDAWMFESGDAGPL